MPGIIFAAGIEHGAPASDARAIHGATLDDGGRLDIV